MGLRSQPGIRTYREGFVSPRRSATSVELMDKKMEAARQFLAAIPEYNEDWLAPCFFADGTIRGPFEAYVVTRAVRWVRALLAIKLRMGRVRDAEAPGAGDFMLTFGLYEDMERYMRRITDQAFVVVAYADGIRVAPLAGGKSPFVADRSAGPYAGQLVVSIPQSEFTTYPGGVR